MALWHPNRPKRSFARRAKTPFFPERESRTKLPASPFLLPTSHLRTFARRACAARSSRFATWARRSQALQACGARLLGVLAPRRGCRCARLQMALCRERARAPEGRVFSLPPSTPFDHQGDWHVRMSVCVCVCPGGALAGRAGFGLCVTPAVHPRVCRPARPDGVDGVPRSRIGGLDPSGGGPHPEPRCRSLMPLSPILVMDWG